METRLPPLVSTNRTVFISHPYSNSPARNLSLVDAICKQLLSNDPDILPISPLHLFQFLDSDASYRDDILLLCESLIKYSDEVWVYKYNNLSNGQLRELSWADKYDKPVEILTVKKDGD